MIRLELNMMLGGPSTSGRIYDGAELSAQLHAKFESRAKGITVYECSKEPHEPIAYAPKMEIVPSTVKDWQQVFFEIIPIDAHLHMFLAAQQAEVKLAFFGTGKTAKDQTVTDFELGGLYLDWSNPGNNDAYLAALKTEDQPHG